MAGPGAEVSSSSGCHERPACGERASRVRRSVGNGRQPHGQLGTCVADGRKIRQQMKRQHEEKELVAAGGIESHWMEKGKQNVEATKTG